MNKEQINKEFNELWHSKWYLEELGSPSGDIKQFIHDQITKTKEETIREVEDSLPKTCQHNEYCEFLEDMNMPCDCGVSHHNALIVEIKDILNKLKK